MSYYVLEGYQKMCFSFLKHLSSRWGRERHKMHWRVFLSHHLLHHLVWFWLKLFSEGIYLGGWPPHPLFILFVFTLTLTHPKLPSPNAPTLAHTIAKTLFWSHAKPLGRTIKAGPNLITPIQSEGWKLKRGIDWPVAKGASNGEGEQEETTIVDWLPWKTLLLLTWRQDTACIQRKCWRS